MPKKNKPLCRGRRPNEASAMPNTKTHQYKVGKRILWTEYDFGNWWENEFEFPPPIEWPTDYT